MYKILIVEDTLSVREEINDILLMEGYTVFQAENGKTGIEMALKEIPDLIVSDILMPVFNGFEMFEMLQENEKTINIPLIFLSAKTEKGDIRIGMNLGAEDYLTKPIDTTDLVNAVKNKIKKKSIRDQKSINEKKELLNTLQSQKAQLDNYSHLILDGLKSSQTKASTNTSSNVSTNVSGLLEWTQEELDTTNNLEEINKKWSAVEQIESNTLNVHATVERVINKINKPPHVTISINNELPTIFFNEKMLEKVFEVLIQSAVDHIDRKIGIVEIDCETKEKEYIFSVKYDYVRISTEYPKRRFEEFQIIKSARDLEVGLIIVEKIISHYKGEISQKSIPNKETIFYFNIPK